MQPEVCFSRCVPTCRCGTHRDTEQDSSMCLAMPILSCEPRGKRIKTCTASAQPATSDNPENRTRSTTASTQPSTYPKRYLPRSTKVCPKTRESQALTILTSPAKGRQRLHRVWNPDTLDETTPQSVPATLHLMFTCRVILMGSEDTINYWWIQ